MNTKKLVSGLLLSTALAAGVGVFAGTQNSRVEKAEAANNNWESLVVYYSASSQITGRISVNRGGVPSGSSQWEDENMSYTNRKCGSNYVYSATVWEYYGGFDDIYFKNGDTVLHHISGWTPRDSMSGKMYNGSSWQTIYTVDFDANGHGTAPSGQYAISGGKATQPTAPTASGYTFDGWYENSSCTGSAWNFSTGTISANKILYAKWTPILNEYTVTKYKVFDGGSPITIESEKVIEGTSYAVPANRYEAGYVFGGWYTTSACTTKYTAKSITANTGIYAKYTSHAAWEGTVYVDLRDSGWAEAAANYAILFMDKTTYSSEVDGWSSYVTGTAADERLVAIPYSLPFEPITMTLVRYNATYSKNNWDLEKWPTDGNKWGQSPDVSVAEMLRVSTVVEDGKNLVYAGYPKVQGGSGAWSTLATLGSVKSNGSHHAEYYSTSVTLTAGQSFKIQVAPYADGDYYGYYSTHSSITSNFSGGKGNNINVVTGGTYAFYFDSISGSVYITKVEIAEADEWAQYFLANVGCDASGRNLPSGWSLCATEYGKLSGAAKNIVYGATAKEDGNYVEQAVARYDVAVRNHSSLTRFIVNSGNTPRSAAININPVANAIANSGSTIAIIAISATVLAAIGGYFLFRKKKEN